MTLKALQGLGAKSEAWLIQAGINSVEDLQTLGAVRAWLQFEQKGIKPGLNFLYALEGALQQRHWQKVARHEKSRLLTELEACRLMHQEFSDSS